MKNPPAYALLPARLTGFNRGLRTHPSPVGGSGWG